MNYKSLHDAPAGSVLEDSGKWIYEHRHGTWGYRFPVSEWDYEADDYVYSGEYSRWFCLPHNQVSDWDDFGPFTYTEV